MRCALCIFGTLLMWVGAAVFVITFFFATFFEIVPQSWSIGGYALMFLGCLGLAGIPWLASLVITQRYCD